MKKFIGDLQVFPTIQDPLDIFCDNKGDIALAREPRAHKKTKHMSRRFNFIWYKFEEGEISIHEVRTD